MHLDVGQEVCFVADVRRHDAVWDTAHSYYVVRRAELISYGESKACVLYDGKVLFVEIAAIMDAGEAHKLADSYKAGFPQVNDSLAVPMMIDR